MNIFYSEKAIYMGISFGNFGKIYDNEYLFLSIFYSTFAKIEVLFFIKKNDYLLNKITTFIIQ